MAATGTTVSRSSATGEPDSTGDGQVNFTVEIAEGYALDSVSVTAGTYKNIKGPTDTGLANTYRITKISGDTTITITTVQCEHGTIASGTTPSWSWSDGYGTATLSYTCADCGNTVHADGNVTSVLTSSNVITFTAKASVGATEYSDTKTAAPFKAAFSCDEGVQAVNVYYTQDYTSADETDVSAAVARDSSTGYPVVTGDGQINFTVVLKNGYTLGSVTASGAYKNLKDTGVTNTYRVTKVTGALTVTVTTEKSEITPADGQVLIGDADLDGILTIKDVTAIQRHIAELELLDGDALIAADVNGDGNVTVTDATCVQMYLAEYDSGYGNCGTIVTVAG